MIPVVIGSHPDSPWIKDWSPRKIGNRPVYVHRNGGYELAALRAAPYSRFLFLQDSCEVLHPSFWDVIDHLDGPSWLFGLPGMYLGVYDHADLAPILNEAPDPVDKAMSIQWEGRIRERLPYPTLWPDVVDASGRYEERHGRMNLVLENDLLRKWKGNWGQG